MRTSLLAIFAACLAWAVAGCWRRPPSQTTCGGATMGTTWSLKADESLPPGLQEEVAQQLTVWEGMLSHWQADSTVSRFNASRSTEWMAVPAEVVEVVETARQIAKETEGALDITIAPLIDLWGFGASGRRSTPPTEVEIAAARTLCGWEHLQARQAPPALRKDLPELRINVSAVAEGWALDRLAVHIRQRGLRRFLLEIGGEVLACGEWRVGIQDPAAPPGQAGQMVVLNDQCLATSGVYRQRFEHEGKRYAHVIDPRTGWPLAHGLASASVLHPEAAQADGLATALLVLGPEKGRKLAQRLGLNVLWFERASGP